MNKFTSRLTMLVQYARTLGRQAAMKWAIFKLSNHLGLVRRKEIWLKPKLIGNPIAIRMQGSSDGAAFEQIFVKRDLEFSDTLSAPPSLIFDLGANVGYASCFLLNAFPSAFVLAVEPDPGNASQCKKNLAPYKGRSLVVEAAVWHSSSHLMLSRGTFGDGREWATEVREALPGEIPHVKSLDILSLLHLCPSDKIDLLKIDIEGSEIALFSKNAHLWLQKVRNLCIEIHGPEHEQAVTAALEGFQYVRSKHGEYSLFWGLQYAVGGRRKAAQNS